MVGVVGGVFTATESAAIAVIYSLIVSVYIYKGLNWKGVWKCLEQCIDTLAIVLILISLSGAFGYCLTNLHVPAKAATFITSISSNRTVVILLLNLIILFLGMIMDMAPIILIATPILLPVAMEMGIHPVQFGIMMVLNCGIGLLTPPVGAVLFIGSAVLRRGKTADGESGQSDIAFLSLYDHRADSDFLYSGYQSLAAEAHRVPVSPGNSHEGA